MASLIIRSGKHRGKKLKLPDNMEVIVGRDADCQIRLASEDVSRRHCRLTHTADGIQLRDLGSRNGTFVNDAPIVGDVVLQPGDHVRVGPMELEVAGAKPKAQSGASEHDIADWLSDDDDTGVVEKSSDTTIIKNTSLANEASTARPAAPEPKAEKPQYRSLAEEAKDIIRKHWEAVREREQSTGD